MRESALDNTGHPVEVGDWVAAATLSYRSAHLRIGKVLRFTPQKMVIGWVEAHWQTKDPYIATSAIGASSTNCNNFVKIQRPDDWMDPDDVPA